ncbi:hypothetical protein F0919_12890 [Taibaiella lutea]|uniref:Uncharacterized protein n=1 Tax=Taibaiella lutea TaxID=2608001 RepID=A0A5M6CHM2_9BACT|nr:hypothetical protein [Taibaiella lutea]KAA5533432.1 hypothetical protein F0919_12890 [Taibaiella lutea]
MEKSRNSSDLRYNIKLRMKPMKRAAKAAIKNSVLKDSGMCKSSYYKAWTLKHNDPKDIPAKMLLAFSKALKVEMEELFNKK